MKMDKILFNAELKKCGKLDDLFELWKKVQANEENYENTTLMDKTEKHDSIEKDSFNKDGYIDENEYDEASVKVLFVLKEANIWAHRDEEVKKGILPENREQIEWYLNYINYGKTNRPKQHEKMGRMAFYLQNRNINDEKAKHPINHEYKKALKACAFMNMNKRGGKGNTTEKYNNYIETYQEFIMKQIEILNPNYIVILGSKENKITEAMTDKFGDKVIQMWHTAYCMRNCIRHDKPEYSEDKNVDCYMREFFNRVEDKRGKN